VTAFSYSMAVRHLVKSTELRCQGTQNPQMKARKNVALLILRLTLVFVVSCVPLYANNLYFILNLPGNFFLFLLNDLDYNKFYFEVALVFSFCLFLINSALNPVALFCTSLTYRKHLKRYLCCCCKANSPPTDIELRRRN